MKKIFKLLIVVIFLVPALIFSGCSKTTEVSMSDALNALNAAAYKWTNVDESTAYYSDKTITHRTTIMSDYNAETKKYKQTDSIYTVMRSGSGNSIKYQFKYSTTLEGDPRVTDRVYYRDATNYYLVESTTIGTTKTISPSTKNKTDWDTGVASDTNYYLKTVELAIVNYFCDNFEKAENGDNGQIKIYASSYFADNVGTATMQKIAITKEQYVAVIENGALVKIEKNSLQYLDSTLINQTVDIYTFSNSASITIPSLTKS